MEISRLKALLNNLSSFIHLSSDNGISSDLIQKYYKNPEEILRLLKPVLDAIVDYEMASDEKFNKIFQELGQSVNQLRELIETWQPLLSRANFVLQFESSVSELRSSSLAFFRLLKSSSLDLPEELSSSSLEFCIKKIKHTECGHTTSIIKKAMKDQVAGVGCSSDILEVVADLVCLRSNQEILIEAVALEKLKENAEQAENAQEAEFFDAMITLVTRMHDRLLLIKQSEMSSPVPIPTDFCCPLSLELMTDPVIVSSGQTYEREFIKNWIEMGLNVCPKTRLTLAHTHLIPNFTVKALIASWCDSNNVKLPDSKKSLGPNQHSSLDLHAETDFTANSNELTHSRSNQETSPASTSSACSPRLFSNETCQEGTPLHRHSTPQGPLTAVSGNVQTLDDHRVSVLGSGERSLNSKGRGKKSASHHSAPLSRMDVSTAVNSDGRLSLAHFRSSSTSGALVGANFSQGSLVDANEAPESSNRTSSYSSEISEVKAEVQFSAVNNHKKEITPLLSEDRSQSQIIWQRPSSRLFPRLLSSPATENRSDISEIEIQVQKLVEELKSPSVDTQREAAAELRKLAKDKEDNRIVIATSGAIRLLVRLLSSTDETTQENAVTALLNLSIDDTNKAAIANAEAIEPLINVLREGSPEAKENSAATLVSLSVIDESKAKIGKSGAVRPLIDLLGNGTPRGKKDAATALFNLSLLAENKVRIVKACAVKYLVDLMDPAFGMVDKAVAVLANLATIPDGRTQIGQANGISALVDVVELGSARGKENAAATLLRLCTDNAIGGRFSNEVLREGAVPPLVALSQSGTPRAKEKAQLLLRHFRNQRNGNAARS